MSGSGDNASDDDQELDDGLDVVDDIDDDEDGSLVENNRLLRRVDKRLTRTNAQLGEIRATLRFIAGFLLVLTVAVGIGLSDRNAGETSDSGWFWWVVLLAIAAGVIVGLVAILRAAGKATIAVDAKARELWGAGKKWEAAYQFGRLLLAWLFFGLVIPLGAYVWLRDWLTQ